MNKCLNPSCNNDTQGKSRYCSDKCKVAYNRNKLNSKTVTETVTNQTVTDKSVTDVTVTPEGEKLQVPTNYGQPDCECMHCQIKRGNKSHNIINHGKYKQAHQLADNEINRVALPGDIDYDGVCLAAKYDSHRTKAK